MTRASRSLISATIATFNQCTRLERAVRCVLARRSPRVELLVVGDASTDVTLARSPCFRRTTGSIGPDVPMSCGAEVAQSELGGFDPAVGAVAGLKFTARCGSPARSTVRTVDEVLTRYTIHQSNLPSRPAPRGENRLEHHLSKHAEGFAPNPAARAHHHCRLARQYESADRRKAAELLERSIALAPSGLRCQAYRLAARIGGRCARGPASRALPLRSASRRKARRFATALRGRIDA